MNGSQKISFAIISRMIHSYSAIKFNEQKASGAKAKRCLSKASKKLTGKGGFPEFIISFPPATR